MPSRESARILAALVAAALVTADVAVPPPAVAVDVRIAMTISYDASQAGPFADEAHIGAQRWNAVTSVVDQLSCGADLRFFYTYGGGSYAVSYGLGRGYVVLDFYQAQQYPVMRIGHILGLPDNYNGSCYLVMSGQGAGTGCTNPYPHHTEATQVDYNFSGTAVTRVAPARSAAVLHDLDRSARIPGTAWAVEPTTGQVVVTADSTVGGTDLARLRAALTRAGGAARLERLSGVLRPTISGGDAIYAGGGGGCSLGFNARAGSTYVFVTAGHCTNVSSSWYADSAWTVYLGSRAGTSFPGNDYGVVRYTNPAISHPSAVNLYPGSRTIRSIGDAYGGQVVQSSGAGSGLRSGTVTGLNATVNYPTGIVTGMIKTNICSAGGDSGGPLFAGEVGLGILSGSSGTCGSGAVSYYQPIREVFSVYGLTLA